MKATCHGQRHSPAPGIHQTIWHLDPPIEYAWYRGDDLEERHAKWVMISEARHSAGGIYPIDETYIFAHPGPSLGFDDWLEAEPVHWTELPGSTRGMIPAAELLTELGYETEDA